MTAAGHDLQDVLGRVRSRLPRHRILWLGASAAVLAATLVPPLVRSDRGVHSEAAAQIVVVALVLALLGRGIVALGLSRAVAMTYMLGAAARLAYLTVTPFLLRAHDAGEHVEYVEYLLAHHSLPPPSAGWSFYHPPLYFVLAALLWRTLTALGVSARPMLLVALQAQSLAFHLGFLAFALLTGKRWLDALPDARLGPDPTVRARLGALFAALLCLWPSGILHSVRIGNDDLFYLCFGGFLFFVTRWWLDGRRRDFNLAAVFATLSMLTKSNGLIAFAVLGVLWGVHVARDPRRSIRSAVKLAWPVVVLFALPAGVTLARAIWGDPGGHHHLLVGNSEHLDTKLAVGNGAANYLWFDLKMLVTQPYSTSWGDEAGRQYFANFMLKTSLLGDYQFDGATLSNLAIVLSFLFLPILACVAVAVGSEARKDLLAALPLPLTVAVSVASLAALRMSIPMACSNDFRYIWPVILPALCLYVRGLARLRELGRPAWARFGETAGWAFAATTLAFFAVLARWP